MFHSKSIGINFIQLSKSWFRFFLYTHTYGGVLKLEEQHYPTYPSISDQITLPCWLQVIVHLNKENYYPTKRESEYDFPLGREPVISQQRSLSTNCCLIPILPYSFIGRFKGRIEFGYVYGLDSLLSNTILPNIKLRNIKLRNYRNQCNCVKSMTC